MRLIELPLVLTVALLSFACGLTVVVAIVFFTPRSERIRIWLAKVRGGEQIRCPVCGAMSTQPFVTGEWHRMPKWLGHLGKGIVCSIVCAQAVDNQPEALRHKISEIEDVVRWVSGAPSAKGKWIIAGIADPS